jgi:hypothetical protein
VTLFGTTSWRLVLTADEIVRATRSIVGDGGHQGLLAVILPKLDTATGAIELDDDVLQRVHRYIENYGTGGYQDRLRAIRGAAWRAGWVQA